MASITKRETQSGVSYRIRVSRGYDSAGKRLKPFETTWQPPDGWSDNAIKRELNRVSGQFEADCRAGLVQTKEERREQEQAQKAENERRRQEEEMRVTFSKYIDIFLHEKSTTFSANTRENYDVVLKRAEPVLGNIKMTDIDYITMKKYIVDLQANGKNQFNGKPLAYRTIIKHYIVLHALFENAIDNKVIPSNPMRDMKRPKPRKDEVVKTSKAYTAEEAAHIIGCLNNEPLKWKALVLFMLDSGCRRGEVVGLKWENVDFKNGKVEICRNAQYTAKRGTYITTPKSGKSRVININAPVLELLQTWRREQALMLFRQGIPNNGFCFTQENGDMMNPQTPTWYLQRFGERYKIDSLHPHALRHTMATLSIANGADIVSVSKKLGHADVAITLNVYSHENDEAMRKACNVLNDVLYQKQA